MLQNPFTRTDKRVDQDVLFALQWKKPKSIEVFIEKSDHGYFAKVTSFNKDNVVTEARTGQELFEMVNDAIYEYLDIPVQYRELLGAYLPPENVRQELSVKIPSKYLNKTITATA